MPSLLHASSRPLDISSSNREPVFCFAMWHSRKKIRSTRVQTKTDFRIVALFGVTLICCWSAAATHSMAVTIDETVDKDEVDTEPERTACRVVHTRCSYVLTSLLQKCTFEVRKDIARRACSAAGGSRRSPHWPTAGFPSPASAQGCNRCQWMSYHDRCGTLSARSARSSYMPSKN